MRPGSTVDLAPVLTNNGDISTTALMRVMVPVVNGVSAYDYEVSSSWTLVDADPEAGVYVYGYGSEGELNERAGRQYGSANIGFHDEKQHHRR